MACQYVVDDRFGTRAGNNYRTCTRHGEEGHGVDEANGGPIPPLVGLLFLTGQLGDDWVTVVALKIKGQHGQRSATIEGQRVKPLLNVVNARVPSRLDRTLVVDRFSHCQVGLVTSIHLHAFDVTKDMHALSSSLALSVWPSAAAPRRVH